MKKNKYLFSRYFWQDVRVYVTLACIFLLILVAGIGIGAVLQLWIGGCL